MKRICNIILLLLCAFLPLKAIACSSVYYKFKANIINNNGAKLYESSNDGYSPTDILVKSGEEVTIIDEKDGFAKIEWKDDNSTKYHYIKSSDYKYKEEMKADAKEYKKYYSYAETIIRNNQSIYSYDVVTTIPANTYFEISTDIRDGQNPWATARYNGKTGWVYIGTCAGYYSPMTVANKMDNPKEVYLVGTYSFKEKDKAYFKDITEEYAILGDESTKKNNKLNYGDKIKIIYDIADGNGAIHYIQTSSKDGMWLPSYTSYYEEYDSNIIFVDLKNEEYTVKDFKNFKDSNISIEENQKYKVKYKMIFSDQLGNDMKEGGTASFGVIREGYAIEINNELYWIIYTTEYWLGELKGLKFKDKDFIKLKLDKDEKYYQERNFFDNDKEEGIIKKGEYDAIVLNDCYYVEGYGFIRYDKPKLNREEKEKEEEQIEEKVPKEENEEIEEEKDIVKEEKNSSKKNLINILCCVLGLTIIAVEIIVILHKKKGKKTKEENKPIN